MRICIDARQIRPYPTGIGRYARFLIEHLAIVDRENEYVVLRHGAATAPVVDSENFHEVAVPYTILTARNMLSGAGVVSAVKADIYHSLFHFLPFGRGLPKSVVTLHDLIAVEHSALSLGSRPRRWWKSACVRPLLRRSLSSADHVVAVSESTRQAVLARYPLMPERISAILSGVDKRVWNDTEVMEEESLFSEVSDDRSFIFSLGNSHPYKNLPRLFEAFSKVAGGFPHVDLVVTGRGNTNAHLRRLAGSLQIDTRVRFVENASDAEVKRCMLRALFFAFPSIVEGFGHPVLEAMACGCPVMTSDRSALKEIAENAALLVDPLDTQSMADGMSRLIREEQLRRDLAAKGKARAQSLTWSQTAQQTLDIYHSLVT